MKTNWTTINRSGDGDNLFIIQFDSKLDVKFLEQVTEFMRRAGNAYITENYEVIKQDN